MMNIFQCAGCGAKRIYGSNEHEPLGKRVLVSCEGGCGKATVHVFVVNAHAFSDLGRSLRLQSERKHWDMADMVFIPIEEVEKGVEA